jgi:hypothetical protein
MLENFGVTEATWREACAKTPGFAISESPVYLARGVAALARAGDADRWAGTIISARQLADAYGITDTDGTAPVTPSLARVSSSASAAHSAIAVNDRAPASTAHTARAKTTAS